MKFVLDSVIENATGQTLNTFTTIKLKNPTGMTGSFLSIGYNNIYYSTARSMARFGLLMLNDCIWNGDTVLHDKSYFDSMISPSQSLNKSYGYLWWLNGKESFMLPKMQLVFNGFFAPDAPADLISGMGKNGQIVSFSQSKNLVVVRMGQAPDSLGFVPNKYLNDLWIRLNAVMCSANDVEETREMSLFTIHDNVIEITGDIDNNVSCAILDINGKIVQQSCGSTFIDIANLPKGVYVIRAIGHKKNSFMVFMKE